MNPDFLPDSFCSIPWSSIEINNLGYYRVCCISNNVETNNGIVKDKNGLPMHVLTHTIEDALNSSLHHSIRESQLRGEKHKNCTTCWGRDNAMSKGLRSTRRTWYATALSPLLSEPVPEWKDAISDNDIWKKPLISLDLKLGNLCNLTCAHCDSINSSQWVEPFMEFSGNTGVNVADLVRVEFVKKPNGRFVIDETNWHQDPKWHEQFKRIAPSLRHIYVTGGEPMLVPFHGEMLEYLVDTGLSENIVLEYDTNLTAINPKISKQFEKFRKVNMRVSLDGIKDIYEYVRFPGSWKTIEKNVLENKDKILSITACLMPYNAWQVPEYEEWAKSENLKSLWRYIVVPNQLNLNMFPIKMREDIIKLYDSHKHIPHIASAMKYLENAIHIPGNDEVIQKFIKWSNFLDNHRSMSWKVLCPELASHLKDY
jgi:MoaA/NifB/PqqE/SkfB family radical SAM enzyme